MRIILKITRNILVIISILTVFINLYFLFFGDIDSVYIDYLFGSSFCLLAIVHLIDFFIDKEKHYSRLLIFILYAFWSLSYIYLN